jgi:methionine synthase II (cobalamin-independent)
MAASIELHFGERALKDPGACRDVAGALAHAATNHVGELRRRLPKAQLWLWIDEPVLNAVLLGSIPTQSGRGRLAAIEPHIVEIALTQVLDAITAAGAATAVHCCASRPPLGLLRRTPADALSIDLLSYSPQDDDEIGELIESGRRLVAGLVPGTDRELSGDVDTVAPLRRLGGRLGFDEGRMAQSVLISPTCGFAGASPMYVRSALAQLTSAARILRDEQFREGGRDEQR